MHFSPRILTTVFDYIYIRWRMLVNWNNCCSFVWEYTKCSLNICQNYGWYNHDIGEEEEHDNLDEQLRVIPQTWARHWSTAWEYRNEVSVIYAPVTCIYERNRCVTSSYLAIRCESLWKGRLWMKTTPGPVRDAVSWLSLCIRRHISVQVK
jgi:hypothetical protein